MRLRPAWATFDVGRSCLVTQRLRYRWAARDDEPFDVKVVHHVSVYSC